MTAWRRLSAVVAAIVIAPVSAAPAIGDANALWTIVHDQCVTNEQSHGDPAPCALVDLGASVPRGYAVLKDLVGATQFLLIPTERITGIESPALLAPDAVNYFDPAWRSRKFVDARAGVEIPRDWMSLAVNSAVGRSQNQLHIHVDCVGADVRDALSRHADAIGPAWRPFPERLAGADYAAMTVAGENLDGVNPIRLLADYVREAGGDMALATLVVVGTYLDGGRPGFVLLAGRAEPAAGNIGAGEQLQDHTACPPPAGNRGK